MKILVLGLNPTSKGGSCGTIRRLKTWLDELGLDIVSFDNISHKQGSVNLRNIDGQYVREISVGYDKIITLGKTADTALDIMGIHHFCLPHPSGLNRQLNQSGYVDQKLKECKDYLWA
jgi:hypothetical protein